jgi:glycosyltransferase involved in cell wall biosynthesis
VNIGHKVTLLVASKRWRGGLVVRDGVEIVTFFDPSPLYCKKGGASIIGMCQRIIWLAGKQFDAVFVDCGFRPTTGVPGYFYSTLKRVPYICEWWDWIGRGGIHDRKSRKYRLTLGIFDNFFESFEKRHADGVVVLSQCLKGRALELGLDDSKICVIHGGADVQTKHTLDKIQARILLDIPLTAFVVGFAGMDDGEVDDVEPFLDSVDHLTESIDGFMWFSTGEGLRIDLKEKYKFGQEYREFGWVDYATYKNCLAAADVLLLILENNLINRARWPNKTGDYMAAQRVVLATDVGEISQFVRAFPETGIVFCSWNRESIILKLQEIQGDPAEATRLGNINGVIASSNCTWDAKARELDAFIARVVSAMKQNHRLTP